VSWEAIRGLGLTIRPFDGPAPEPAWKRSAFGAPFHVTLHDLSRELRMLEAKNVVLECAFQERDIRVDGLPRADRNPSHPGIRIAFDSKHGPLRYETAEYDRWTHNLRAIGLSMNALRAVDRYGVSKRGEQYRGWRAIAMTSSDDSLATPLHAREFLEQWGGDVKRAIRETHPDAGGDEALFRKVIRARELVGG
jgi:hypothetical protein